MSDAQPKPAPIRCGAGHVGEEAPLLEPQPTVIDQTDRAVKPMPGFVWRCICGWARELPARLVLGNAYGP